MFMTNDDKSAEIFDLRKRGWGSRIDTVVEQALRDKRLVGVVVLVAQDGKLVYQRAKGMSNREAGTPMQLDTLFRLASVSKPIVSAAALALVAQGRLALEDEVSRWLPEFRPRLAGGAEAALTVRHLLTHTAGLTYGFLERAGGEEYKRAGVSDGMELSDLSLEENIRRIASAPLLYEPGTAWGYSLATDVLGAVIARVFGGTLADAVRVLVTEPLGMGETSFAVPDQTRLAAAYVNAEPEPKRMGELEVVPVFEGTEGLSFAPGRAFNESAFHSGGSGMIGTAGEFLHFLETLRQGGGNVLPAALVAEMASNQAGGLELAPWPGRGFGLGFTILKDPQLAQTPESAGSWRLGGAYGHSWFVDPSRKLSVVAFTNTAFEGMFGQFTVDLCNAVYGEE